MESDGHSWRPPTAVELQFAEDVALYFESEGPLPRMLGRIIGWLLICDPPEQTAGQLATALRASKGSISTGTRALEQAGLIERVVKPGERRDYFRIDHEGWIHVTLRRLAAGATLLKVLDRGAELLIDSPPERRERLDDLRDLYGWLHDELPPMLTRYAEERRRWKRGLR